MSELESKGKVESTELETRPLVVSEKIDTHEAEAKFAVDGVLVPDGPPDEHQEETELTPPLSSSPDAPADLEEVSVNLVITRRMQNRLNHYAIDHGDKTIVAIIQEIVEGFLKSEGY